MNVADFVKSRGYNVEPVLNTGAAAEGKPLQLMGYRLIGPRGNEKVVEIDNLFAAQLWCDGVDYASRKVAARKASR
jgi:hypothetical protein